MNLLEQVLFEALSPELKAALTGAGHTIHVSQANVPDQSTVVLHDNPRTGAGVRTIVDLKTGDPVYSGRREGPYRLTFVDKAPIHSSYGTTYEETPTPSHHISYDDPEKAAEHFTVAKALHAAGIPNEDIVNFLSAGDHGGFNYHKSDPFARRDVFDMMKMDHSDEVANKLDAIKDSLPMYKESVDKIATALTEGFEILPIVHKEPIKQTPANTSGYRMPYRKLAQIATMMGVADGSYTPD